MISEIDVKCVNVIRMLSAELPLIAKSGHQGSPIGCAPIVHILYSYIMNYNPDDTKWINRDRFVLSNGHASSLLYTMLYLTNQGLTMDDLRTFRQLHSKTPGHPENILTPGVEVTTGPLGQGISNAVGMAISIHNLSQKYNINQYQIFDNYIYCLCGDGCLQEGVSNESISLAGHLGLGRLILIYDDNNITIDGHTNLSFTDNIKLKFESLNWEVKIIKDGNNDLNNIYKEIEESKKNLNQPTIIIIKTICGFGTNVANTHKAHGFALKYNDIKEAKIFFGLDPNKELFIPDDVRNFYNNIIIKKKNNYINWEKLFNKYKELYPNKYNEIIRRFNKELPINWKDNLPKFNPNDPGMATRAFSGIVLNSLNKILPELIGGSADLSESNNTLLNGESDIQKGKYNNKYIRFGVREHGMVSISNGIYAYGGFEPFCGTFLNFYIYAYAAVRLAALSNHHILLIATHDSVELGEDGPTHQPIEVLPLLRATPNLHSIRPGDGNEVVGGYISHFTHKNSPTVLCLCRNKVNNLENTNAEKVLLGAYILDDFDNNNNNTKVILAGCGTELWLLPEAKKILKNEHNLNVRVVSFPSWSLFKQQSEEYKNSIFLHKHPDANKIVRFYIEPSSTFGFDTYFNLYIGIDRFGFSAPKDDIFNYLGFTVDNIVQKIINFIKNDFK